MRNQARVDSGTLLRARAGVRPFTDQNPPKGIVSTAYHSALYGQTLALMSTELVGT